MLTPVAHHDGRRYHIPVGELERLTEEFLARPEGVEIAQAETLLGLYGYALRKGGGSHRVFHKPGATPITVPTVGPHIKKEYVKMLVAKLQLEAHHDR